MGKALTSISPWDWGLFWYVVADAKTGVILWLVFRTIAHVPVNVSRIQMTPESSSHLVLLPFSTPSPIYLLSNRISGTARSFPVHCWRA